MNESKVVIMVGGPREGQLWALDRDLIKVSTASLIDRRHLIVKEVFYNSEVFRFPDGVEVELFVCEEPRDE